MFGALKHIEKILSYKLLFKNFFEYICRRISTIKIVKKLTVFVHAMKYMYLQNSFEKYKQILVFGLDFWTFETVNWIKSRNDRVG